MVWLCSPSLSTARHDQGLQRDLLSCVMGASSSLLGRMLNSMEGAVLLFPQWWALALYFTWFWGKRQQGFL